MKAEKKKREMTFGLALVGCFAPLLIIVALIFLGVDVAIATLIALFVMAAFCIWMGISWKDIDAAMSEGVHQVAGATVIMLLVGCMVASWMSSGTIPTLLYYGMKIVTPSFYLPVCFLLPAFISICTGTSWGSISTIGVVLCGMSAGLGIPAGMAAGLSIQAMRPQTKINPARAIRKLRFIGVIDGSTRPLRNTNIA